MRKLLEDVRHADSTNETVRKVKHLLDCAVALNRYLILCRRSGSKPQQKNLVVTIYLERVPILFSFVLLLLTGEINNQIIDSCEN